jgi:hypothetical protein
VASFLPLMPMTLRKQLIDVLRIGDRSSRISTWAKTDTQRMRQWVEFRTAIKCPSRGP